jgi:hypothetical protein
MEKMRKFIFPFMIISVFLTSFAMAQENETKDVCLVYFTSHGCGDDCGLTDTFMDGLMNEYRGNLISIIYYTDDSPQNRDVFEAYRMTYNLPQDTPIVLFGKDDYLQGKNNVYANTELKIFDFLQMNGTNCPLDSGYVPPSQLNVASLPGSPQIRTSGAGQQNATDGQTAITEKHGDNVSSENGTNNPSELFIMNEPMRESVLSFAIIGIVLIIVAIIVIYIWKKTQESL